MGEPDPTELPRFACPDWWAKITAGETPMPDVPLNEVRAAKALAFFNRLRLPDVIGQPAMKNACGQWFKDILVAFLASEDPETKQRLVWELLCMVPKKNSKTTYVAGLGLTALYLNEVPSAQMLIVAPSQNISERCFGQAEGMIRADPLLGSIFHVQAHLKKITRHETGAELEVKTFDTSIVTGEIPALTIIDELHELGKKNGALSVMQQIRGGGITKSGGQVLMITTQSDKPPAGVWDSELRKARAIRDGRGGARPILLPVLYEFPAELQKKEEFWRDRRNWPLVLPNLDRSIDQDRLEADYDNNGSASGEAEQIWVSQHLNIEIGLGLHANRWVGTDFWSGCEEEGLTLESLLASSDVAVIGADGGGRDDLFGLAVIGRHRKTRLWQMWAHAWCLDIVPQDRRKSLAPVLSGFERDGDLTITTSDHQIVVAAVEVCDRVRESGLLPEKNAIGLDQAKAAAFEDELEAAGFVLDEDVVGVPQNYLLQRGIGRLEGRLTDGRARHGGQRLLTWAVGNAKSEVRGSNTYITKEAAGVAKIDPLMALFNASYLMTFNPEPRHTSVFEQLASRQSEAAA